VHAGERSARMRELLPGCGVSMLPTVFKRFVEMHRARRLVGSAVCLNEALARKLHEILVAV
jgi:hypothetical protein